jgi:hypothetical protein
MSHEWIDHTFDYEILSEKNEFTPFEGEFPYLLPGFYKTQADESFSKSYLKIGIPGETETYSDLFILSSNGAYISEFYSNNFDAATYVENPRELRWFINPFLLFQTVFNLFGLPIPDTTTLAGRRIFFSTCHGDSWNMISDIEKYKNQDKLCSEVILEEVVKPNPDIPVCVAVVAADVDLKWVGTKKSQEVARHYFLLPQVEPASHSYSHPFDWVFFKSGEPEKEINYLYLYPYGTWQNSYLSWLRARYYEYFKPDAYAKDHLKWGYVIPRAYANYPFNLEQEIGGSIDFINQFTPPNKPVRAYVWPGDSLPWDKPMELCYQSNIPNFGGGFVRFDTHYPSLLFVYPLARKPGGMIQLYATANGENDYTQGWKDQFYGFQQLYKTLENTEKPRRLKPILLYYHSYSGQFESSVNALLKNIDFIRKQDPIPIALSRFCEIGLGFYETKIDAIGADKWKILNRKDLQTIRFDIQGYKVDFSESYGVIGFMEYQNSLYVYLDQTISEPIISLKQAPMMKTPFLVDSSWEIWNLKRDARSLSFQTQGWGKLKMRWNMRNEGTYTIQTGTQQVTQKTEKQILKCDLDLPYNTAAEVTILFSRKKL